MKTKKLKTILSFFAVTIFFLVLTKVDFRISEPQTYHSHDDASYYFHAYTLGIDFDLDYSNQISKSNDIYKTNYLNKKLVPKHPIGSGLLSSPFVFLGNSIENIFYRIRMKMNHLNSQVSFNLFIF